MPLTKFGVSRNKIKAMDSLAHKFHEISMVISENNLHAVRSRLLQVWGIGPWTADIFLLFYLRDEDVFPANDISLTRAICDLTETTEFNSSSFPFINFSPYRSYLALQLWAYVDNR